MYAVPADKAMAAKVGLPFGAIVAPLADLGQNDDTVAVVNPGTPSGEPTSCPKCGAYFNPFVIYDSVGTCICSFCGEIHECKRRKVLFIVLRLLLLYYINYF